MVRKVRIMLAIVALVCAIGTTAHAASYTPYDGNPSNTYIQYFKDIVAGISLKDNYVAFRAGQNEYIMCVGDLEHDGERIVLQGTGVLYRIATDGNYNANYTYEVQDTTDFSLNINNRIIYTDVGGYPQLMDRGAIYETYAVILIAIALLGVSIYKFFFSR